MARLGCIEVRRLERQEAMFCDLRQGIQRGARGRPIGGSCRDARQGGNS